MINIRFKKIWQKISFFLWSVIIFTVLGSLMIFIPYTNNIFEEKLVSEAENIIAAVQPSLNSSIAIDDYSDFLDFTLNLLPQNRYCEYLVITKKNGFSIIIENSKWKVDTLNGKWISTESFENYNSITTNELSENEVFNYSKKIDFPGMNWGNIHIGLNLTEYYENKNKLITFAFVLSLAFGIITLFLAILFGRRLARPIYELNDAAHAVAKGDLTVICDIKTGDEIEDLANTFNHMTSEIFNSHSQLEETVQNRTQNLVEINAALEIEIEFRKKAEEKVKESLDEKIALLKEIHHKVKNNLQIISSLLFLQIEKSDNPIVNDVLLDSQNRVKAMALVHEKLYKSIDLAEIEFDDYIKDICQYISSSLNNEDIKIIFDLEKRYLSINSAVLCGLIINELISNVLKYAFPEEKVHPYPQLIISLKLTKKNNFILSIRDNGVGLPPELDIDTIDSLGLKLVQNLVNQLDGKLQIINSGGTEFVITFEEKEYRGET